MSQPQVWFITGASAGFGRHTTELVLGKGGIVVAAARKTQALDDLKSKYPDRLLVVEVDVTNTDQIASAFEKIKETYGRLDVVYNNAGVVVYSEVETTPRDAARAQFETNFWGAAEVTIQAVKFFRDVNKPAGGRLLNMSGVLGVVGLPVFGFHAATKHALEGLTKSLVAELDPEWNIKITLIEAGTFRTDAVQNSILIHPSPMYDKPTLPGVHIRQHLMGDQSSWGNPVKAAEKIYQITQVADPPLRLPLGKDLYQLIPPEINQIQDDLAKYESWTNDLYDT
ncbi:NAD(P)-binding protein [Panus rudis PR-1116 ss-1]|nr:NAD(P)-binding protein [Panus rudis PR-1116 ss-1]